MIRALVLIACLVPAASLAQSTFEPPADLRAAHEMMRGQRMMQGQHMMDGQLGRRPPPSPDKARSPQFRRSSKFSWLTPRPIGPRSISTRFVNTLST